LAVAETPELMGFIAPAEPGLKAMVWFHPADESGL
jgi:hypothetical protein